MKRNKSVTPSPAPAPASAPASASASAPTPSGPSSVAPSLRSTPVDIRAGSQILILHAESYYSRPSTSTPVPIPSPAAPTPALGPAPTPAPEPESALTSTLQAKSKPRPRARRKQPTPQDGGTVANELGVGEPLTPIQEPPNPEVLLETNQPAFTKVGSKRPGASTGEKGVRVRKRQRTADPSSVPATQPSLAAAAEDTDDTVMVDNRSPDEDGHPEGTPEVKAESVRATPRRGRGKGRSRGRGPGSGRGRRSVTDQAEEGVHGDVVVDVSMAQSEPGSSAGPTSGRRSTASVPTRRQPPRAANKASRLGEQLDGAP